MCLCPKELLNMTPGSRKEKKCHATHRCDTQDGQDNGHNLGLCTASHACSGECNPRKAIKQDTLFSRQLKQNPVIHSPRYLSNFKKDDKYCGITNTKTLFISHFE